MKNGPYEMVIALKEYPGRKYRGRYVYEHHLVWWKHTGEILPDGMLIHHKNENKRDNRFKNLELKSFSDHSKEHNKPRIRRQKLKCSSYGTPLAGDAPSLTPLRGFVRELLFPPPLRVVTSRLVAK